MPAWTEAWNNLKRGDLSAATGSLFLSAEDIEAGRRADDHLAQIAARNRERGIYDDAQYARTIERLGYSNTSVYAGQVGQAFEEGAAEGLATMQAGVKGTLNKTALGILGFIPWWVWLLAALWLAWQLGLLNKLVRKAAA